MEVLRNATQRAHVPHPYYPLEVEIVGYLANERPVPTLLSIFFGGCALIVGSTYAIMKSVRPTMPKSEVLTFMWLFISGTIHLFFEGYYAYNFKSMGGLQTLFGQLWKEYALSDSRYLTQDPFVLCMESITAAFWGPLSYVVAWMITSQHPLRHPLQIIVAVGQIYGDILYYATSMFDYYLMDKQYSRPELYYFWGYYFFMNFIWIVIPGFLVYDSVKATARAFQAAKKAPKGFEAIGNGEVKKSI